MAQLLDRSLVAQVEKVAGTVLFSSVDVGPPGHVIRIKWNGVVGATEAEVTEAAVQIAPSMVEETLGDLAVTMGDSNRRAEVSVPTGKRIVSLNLQDLKDEANVLITSQSSLSTQNLRLVVTVASPGGGFGPPLYAVPSSPRRGMLPASLTGATFSSGTLRFNTPIKTNKIRLALARNQFPEDFDPVGMSVGKVSGTATITPRDLTLTDPSGAVVWSFPGEMPDEMPAAIADLRLALETAIKKALTSGAPLDFTFLLKASTPAKARVRFDGARGFLLHTFPGVLKSDLSGDPKPPLPDPILLPSETPASATADLTVHYQGVRILETVSDPLLRAGNLVSGVVVGTNTVLRAFPPQAFGSLPLARLGLIGRAPEETELVVQPVNLETGGMGVPTGAPGVKKLSASTDIHQEWVELPDFAPPTGPMGLAVHTNQGRFLWAVDGQPLVRVAVFDPNPGGRALKLGGHNIIPVDQVEIHKPGFSLPVAAFRSAVPSWESDLFLKLELSDLVLRYRRST